MKKKRNKILKFLVSLLVISSCAELPSNQSAIFNKVNSFNSYDLQGFHKGIWIPNTNSAFLSFSEDEMLGRLNTLRHIGYDTIYPVVYSKGYPVYNSQFMQSQVFNPFQENNKLSPEDLHFLEYAKNDSLRRVMNAVNRMENPMHVIAWFEWGTKIPKHAKPLEQSDSKDGVRPIHPENGIRPIHPLHVYAENNGMLFSNQKTSQEYGWSHNYADPSSQAFGTMMNSMVSEVISYGVNGVIFDDHLSVPSKSINAGDTQKPGFGDHLSHRQNLAQLIKSLSRTARASNKFFMMSLVGKPDIARINFNLDISLFKDSIDRWNFQLFRNKSNQHGFENDLTAILKQITPEFGPIEFSSYLFEPDLAALQTGLICQSGRQGVAHFFEGILMESSERLIFQQTLEEQLQSCIDPNSR